MGCEAPLSSFSRTPSVAKSNAVALEVAGRDAIIAIASGTLQIALTRALERRGCGAGAEELGAVVVEEGVEVLKERNH